jgi:hypothetical protein
MTSMASVQDMSRSPLWSTDSQPPDECRLRPGAGASYRRVAAVPGFDHGRATELKQALGPIVRTSPPGRLIGGAARRRRYAPKTGKPHEDRSRSLSRVLVGFVAGRSSVFRAGNDGVGWPHMSAASTPGTANGMPARQPGAVSGPPGRTHHRSDGSQGRERSRCRGVDHPLPGAGRAWRGGSSVSSTRG